MRVRTVEGVGLDIFDFGGRVAGDQGGLGWKVEGGVGRACISAAVRVAWKIGESKICRLCCDGY